MRRSGLDLVRRGLIVAIATAGVSLLADLADSNAEQVEFELSAGATLFLLLVVLVAIAELIFQIVALIWLFNNERKLPLRRG